MMALNTVAAFSAMESRTSRASEFYLFMVNVMFVYLLIALELLILYSAYYYIFLWEPREYRINKDIWGLYDAQKKRATAIVRILLSFQIASKKVFVLSANRDGSGIYPAL